MDDKIEINLTYSRAEILEWAQKCIDKGGDIYQTRDFLDGIYPAWRMDQRTSCLVELMFRGPDDIFYDMFTSKLAELDAGHGLNYCPSTPPEFR